MERTDAGKMSYDVRPTTRPPAPMAKSSSVVVGLSDTMRSGTGPSTSESP